MHTYIQANTNGRLHDAAEPSLGVLDRSFLYGDAVYEVWRTVHGIPFAFEEHFERLEASAHALFLELPFDREGLLHEMRRTCAAFVDHDGWQGELYVRLQLSRGGGPIGLDPALADKPTFVLIVQPLRGWPDDVLERGIHLSVATSLRRNPAVALNPAWKTGNYLNNLLCLREARSRGADEVVILNLEGEVTEAAVSNILFVRGGNLVTPPLSAGILAGVTRRILIERVAPAAWVKVVEEPVRPADFAKFDECGLASTTKNITPVASIDENRFSRPGDGVLARLKSAFGSYMEDYAAEHNRYRVV
ncbi:MAG TPA: aminotransferase class IV [Opitutaceae bacterium]